MSGSLLNGCLSPANWARKIPGPLTVFIMSPHLLGRSLRQAYPAFAHAAAVDGALHKRHAAHALIDVGYQVTHFGGGIGEPGAYSGAEIAIDVGKGLNQTLRVTKRQAESLAGRGGEIVPGSMQRLAWLPEPVHFQVVRVLLPPVEAAFFTVQMKLKIVAIARGNLRNMQHSGRSVVELEQDVAV